MKKLFVFTIIILSLTQPVWAEQDYSYDGNISLHNYYYGEQDEQYVPEASLDLNTKLFLGNWQVISNLQARYNYLELEQGVFSEEDDYRPYVSMEEFYVNAYWQDLDFNLGICKINWGITDRFNPIDIINPVDLTDIINERKIGLPVLALTYWPPDWQIELVIAPYFMASRLPPANSYFYYGSELPVEEDLPEFTWQNMQAGLLVNWQYKSLSLTTMAYYGYDHLPFVELLMITPIDYQLVYHYERMSAFGGGFEYAYDKFVFRGEGAYYVYPEFDDQDYGQYVLGFDYSFGQINQRYNLYFTAQYLGETPQREDPDWIRHLFTQAVTAKIIYGNEFTEFSFEEIWILPHDGLILIPSFIHSFENNLAVKLEYDYFLGIEDTYWHFNEKNNRFVFSVKYSF
ncbi:hypothetical protein ACFL2U_03680 [Patescibacteria group bacterium]